MVARPDSEPQAGPPPYRSGPTPPDPGEVPALAGAALTIDIGAIARNYRRVAMTAAPARTAAVVKADAYGLGLNQVAPALWAAGARLFFTAHPDEALALRELLPDARIAVLNGLMPGAARLYAQSALIPVLNHPGDIAAWAEECRLRQTRLPAFIHLDTGMNRLGLSPGDQAALAQAPQDLDRMHLLAWMTHLTAADDITDPSAENQLRTLNDSLARLPLAPVSIANSPGVFRDPAFRGDLVRPGCALYGVNPRPGRASPVEPVIRLDAKVLQIRDIGPGEAVGYGGSYVAERPLRIATLAIGYADGYMRHLSNSGVCILDGYHLPVVGRISMDLTTVDISALPQSRLAPGDMVTVIGPGVDVDAVANACGTIGYEVLTALGHRYHRIYRDTGINETQA